MAKFPYGAVVVGPVEHKQAAIDFMAALEYSISPNIGLIAVGEDPYSSPTHLGVCSPVSQAVHDVLSGATVISPTVTALLANFTIDLQPRSTDPYSRFMEVAASLGLQRTIVSETP